MYRVKKIKRRIFRKFRHRDETRLKKALRNYLNYEASVEAVTEEDLFRILLPIRWSLYGLTYNHLVLDRKWKWKDFFLEYPDITDITANGDGSSGVVIVGEFIWWAEGKDWVGKWWPADRAPYKQIRVCIEDQSHLEIVQAPELEDGGFLVEPFEAIIWPAWNKKRGLKYRIEFGKGATYRHITNCKNGALPVEQANTYRSSLSRTPATRPRNWNECWEAELKNSREKIYGDLYRQILCARYQL
jgi:hypothetical protein